MRQASDGKREWLREVRRSLEDWIKARPRAKEIIAEWQQQRADPDVLYFLLYGYRGTSEGTSLMYLYERLRPHVEKAATHLDGAFEELNRGIQVPAMPEDLRSKVIEAICEPIQGLRQTLLFVLGSKRFPARRPHDRYATMFMRDLSQYLQSLTGRPHWREIAELVNKIDPRKDMTDMRVRARCLQYRARDSHTVRETVREAKSFWKGLRSQGGNKVK